MISDSLINQDLEQATFVYCLLNYFSFNYYTGDYNLLRSRCAEIEWKEIMCSVEESWEYFSSTIMAFMDECIPKRIYNGHFRKKRNLWMTKDELQKVREKKMAWEKVRATKTTTWLIQE